MRKYSHECSLRARFRRNLQWKEEEEEEKGEILTLPHQFFTLWSAKKRLMGLAESGQLCLAESVGERLKEAPFQKTKKERKISVSQQEDLSGTSGPLLDLSLSRI